MTAPDLIKISEDDYPVLLEAALTLTGQYEYWLRLRLTTQAERELARIKLAALDRITTAMGYGPTAADIAARAYA